MERSRINSILFGNDEKVKSLHESKKTLDDSKKKSLEKNPKNEKENKESLFLTYVHQQIVEHRESKTSKNDVNYSHKKNKKEIDKENEKIKNDFEKSSYDIKNQKNIDEKYDHKSPVYDSPHFLISQKQFANKNEKMKNQSNDLRKLTSSKENIFLSKDYKTNSMTEFHDSSEKKLNEMAENQVNFQNTKIDSHITEHESIHSHSVNNARMSVESTHVTETKTSDSVTKASSHDIKNIQDFKFSKKSDFSNPIISSMQSSQETSKAPLLKSFSNIVKPTQPHSDKKPFFSKGMSSEKLSQPRLIQQKPTQKINEVNKIQGGHEKDQKYQKDEKNVKNDNSLQGVQNKENAKQNNEKRDKANHISKTLMNMIPDQMVTHPEPNATIATCSSIQNEIHAVPLHSLSAVLLHQMQNNQEQVVIHLTPQTMGALRISINMHSPQPKIDIYANKESTYLELNNEMRNLFQNMHQLFPHISMRVLRGESAVIDSKIRLRNERKTEKKPDSKNFFQTLFTHKMEE